MKYFLFLILILFIIGCGSQVDNSDTSVSWTDQGNGAYLQTDLECKGLSYTCDRVCYSKVNGGFWSLCQDVKIETIKTNNNVEVICPSYGARFHLSTEGGYSCEEVFFG
ncbi:hypothetical protein ACFL1H_07255 [Nanoarchaeota archaeon]